MYVALNYVKNRLTFIYKIFLNRLNSENTDMSESSCCIIIYFGTCITYKAYILYFNIL